MNCSVKNKGVKKQKQIQRAIEHTTDGMVIMLFYVLADKYGFGHKKLMQVMKSVEYVADSINKGYISMDDIKETLSKEHDITVEFKRRNNDK